MLATSKSSDPVFDTIAHKLNLMLFRWKIENGRLIVADPDAALWWLDKEIAEMGAENEQFGNSESIGSCTVPESH